MGENLLKRTGLRPNWDEHAAATCSIINYFADRNNATLILVKQENEIGKNCYFCNFSKNCKRLKECRAEFKQVVFRHLTSMLEFGMFLIQNGRIETEYFP